MIYPEDLDRYTADSCLYAVRFEEIMPVALRLKAGYSKEHAAGIAKYPIADCKNMPGTTFTVSWEEWFVQTRKLLASKLYEFQTIYLMFSFYDYRKDDAIRETK